MSTPSSIISLPSFLHLGGPPARVRPGTGERPGPRAQVPRFPVRYGFRFLNRRGLSRAPGSRLGYLLVTALSLAFLSAACESSAADAGRVTRILDGDSLIVSRLDGTTVEVRIFGIDAPEYRQPWSRRSREALGDLVGERMVRLEVMDIDRYGRSVAVVHRDSDGVDIGREMVRLGHAWVYRRYTDDAALIRLEDGARAAGIGLWSMPESERVPPWQWRRQNRRVPVDEHSR